MAVSEEVLVRIRGDLSDVQAKLGQLDQRVNRSASNAQSRFQQMGRALTAAFAGVATIAAVRGFANMATASLQAAEALDDMANRANVGIEFLQEMRDAANNSGASARDFDDAISRLNRRLGLFQQNGGGPAAQAFQDLGLATRIASGELSDAESVFNAAVEAMQNVEGQARRSALASQLFGEDSGPRLLTLMSQGVEGVNNLRDAAREGGRVMEESLVRQASAASDALERMGNELRTRLNSAVAENADGLVALAQLLSNIATAAIEAAAAIGRFFTLSDREFIASAEQISGQLRSGDNRNVGNLQAFARNRLVGDEQARLMAAARLLPSEGGVLTDAAAQQAADLIDAMRTGREEALRLREAALETGEAVRINLGGGSSDAAADVQDLASYLDELSASLEALPANVGNFEEQNKAKLESLAEAAVVAGAEFERFTVSAESAADSVTGAIGSAFERMALGIRVTFQDLARDILAIMARVAFNNLIAAPLSNFLGNAFSSIPGLGSAAPAVAAAPAMAGAPQNTVYIDARGSGPGVEEKIRDVLRQEMPAYQRQAAGLAVSSISAIQSKRSIG